MHPTYEIVLALAFILGLWFERNKRTALLTQIAKLEIEKADAEQRAMTDALTGLMNRRGLSERIEALETDARRNNRPIGIIFIDLDHFKRINDTLGHGVGDKVLAGVGKLLWPPSTDKKLRRLLRKSDVVGRWGGEEIIVLGEITCIDATERTPHEAVQIVAERLRQAIQALMPGGVEITVSIGAAVFDPGRNPDDTLQLAIGRADAHVYMAKAAGRNCVSMNLK